MWKSFISLWLKFPCPLCQRTAEDVVCRYCQKKLESCQLKNSQALWQGDLPVFAWGGYEGELKRAIATLKYHNHPEIGILLGKWLGETWRKNNLINPNQRLTIVPIPLHQTKLRSRGFNQAASLARGFCQVTGNYLEPEALIRVKASKAMFELNPAQRKENLHNAFVLNKNWQKASQSRSILLVDDIYTTGTTIREASQILRQHNLKVLGAIVVATPCKI